MRTLILCAINKKEPYISQMEVLRRSIELNSLGEERRFDVFPQETAREYMVCHRTIMFADALMQGYDRVAWMDADCIVRAPLDGFWTDVLPDTIKIVYRPKKKPNRRFQAAVFAVGNGPNAGTLVKEWNEIVQKSPEWYKDQEELYKCWQKHRDKVGLIPMKRKFNDSTFNDKSVIWHSKGHHFDDPKFQKEYQYYLRNAEDEKSIS